MEVTTPGKRGRPNPRTVAPTRRTDYECRALARLALRLRRLPTALEAWQLTHSSRVRRASDELTVEAAAWVLVVRPSLVRSRVTTGELPGRRSRDRRGGFRWLVALADVKILAAAVAEARGGESRW